MFKKDYDAYEKMVDGKSPAGQKGKCIWYTIITVIVIALLGSYIYYKHDPIVYKGRLMITDSSSCLMADDKRIVKVEQCNVWHSR